MQNQSSGSSEFRAENLINLIQVKNAKKVCILLVVGFIIFHGYLHFQYGSNSCSWLLTKGFKGNKEWQGQAYGCMIHKYTQIDTRHCFRYLGFWGYKNHFVFVGDTRIRMLYQTFINHFRNEDDNQSTLIFESEKNGIYSDLQLNLRVTYKFTDDLSNEVLRDLAKYEMPSLERIPAVFVFGFTHENFFKGNVTKEIIRQHTLNLTRLIAPFDKIVAKKSKVLWKLQDQVNEAKLPERWKNITNQDIEKYNKVAKKVLQHSAANIWESSTYIASGLLDNNNLESPLALKHDVQILLNMYCNDFMNYNDGTCCSSAEQYTVLQIITYSFFAICFILMLVIFLRRWFLNVNGHTFYAPIPQGFTTNSKGAQPVILNITNLVNALATLGVILAYFYLCDRTKFFMKENKYYSEFSFWIPVGYVFILGLFFTEDSRFTKVLNPDQTDEMKGWIILVILTYYLTGADRVLPIHMHIRVLISTLLFLTGYSNASYAWLTGNCGVVKFFQVMFQTNFMTVILCFCMNRPYQFYYFVPLMSFWICMMYFVLRLPPQVTTQSVDSNVYHYLYIVLKMIAMMSVITIFYMSQVFFERIFVTRPWKALFVTTDDDIHEWWYQWKLDRYSVVFGMVFAYFVHIAQKYNIFDDGNHGNLFARKALFIFSFLALFGVGSYTSFSFLCKNKLNCDEIHSYIVFIPIIGYIILRNISGIIRTKYSTFFAWFGKISLELFICQYHIWLAADRHGVLVLLPGFPTANMIITSFIFVCISHEVHTLTKILMPYVVPNDWKLVLRNFVVFLVILVPIALNDGMF